jgi:hypothetical protein
MSDIGRLLDRGFEHKTRLLASHVSEKLKLDELV